MKVLVTGSAGFIGFHLCSYLANSGIEVIGLDDLNSFQNEKIKWDRLVESGIDKQKVAYNSLIQSSINRYYKFVNLNILDVENLGQLFMNEKFDKVIHLAAQAGVRLSVEEPSVYLNDNIIGFFNILESCRKWKINHLIFASSSSVYGNNKNVPFSTLDQVDQPVSFYAATKKSNELMAYTYSHLFDIKVTGLRFFTVYGPWGRPDMAYFSFTKKIIEGSPINVYNFGNLSRDFTYIDDIVSGIYKICTQNTSFKYKIYNLGNNKPVTLNYFINCIEKAVGKEAIKKMVEMQPGDVETTYANIDEMIKDYNYKPIFSIDTGIKIFVEWYNKYNKKA